MEKNKEINRAKALLKTNKIHPLEVESIFSLISNEKDLSLTEKANKILEYQT